MPLIAAPLAGLASVRIGPRPILAGGMVLQAASLAWIAAVATPTVAYSTLVPAFVVAGIGMGLFFAPIANVVLSSVHPTEEGKASGVNNAIREVGGVFGVAVLAAVFSLAGDYGSAEGFVSGLVPALWVGAAVIGVGAIVAIVTAVRPTAADSPARPEGVPAVA
jgi:MFS family permease